MDTVEVRLLGRPQVLVDGQVTAPPRGAKAWGLLAYLASSEVGRSRSELAELLFGVAEDPLGALRWNLAALRRLLGLPDALKGDPLHLEPPEWMTIDSKLLSAGDPAVLGQHRFGQELLAGLRFSDCPVFETWLVAERRRLMYRATSLMSEAALMASARGDHDTALRHATELVTHDPLDEGHHALLIRAHVAAGDARAARCQFEACQQLLRRELGTEPGPAVLAALRAADSLDRPQVISPSPDEAQARVIVAWQSFLSGTVDHAIDVMRGAIAIADAGGDGDLRANSRIFLGAMMGMAVRGWDEAATVLSEALHIADRDGRSTDAATALGVRAGVDMMRGDYTNARRCCRAGFARSDHPEARSVNLMFLAATDADLGDLDGAADHIRSATTAAEASGDLVRILYAHAHAARIHLMRKDIASARAEVTKAAAAGEGSMQALQPWLLTMLAEIETAEGHLHEARAHVEEAASLASVTDITWQQALASRSIGLIDAAAGDTKAAVTSLTEALAQSRRTSGEGYTFHWPIAFILDSLVEVTAVEDPSASRRWAVALLDHATAIGMTHFADRAQARLSEASPV